MSIIEKLQVKYPKYKQKWNDWSNHASGMLQLVIWTQLELEGFGASLQHYNPIIDNEVKEKWNIPQKWELIAQMPFGKPKSPPEIKKLVPISEKFLIYL